MHATSRGAAASAVAARNAVAIVFVLNGVSFATWVSRLPESRAALGLTPGQLGILLLALSSGSLLGTPTAGWWVARFGPARVVATAAGVVGLGMVAAGLGATVATEVALVAVGLFAFGVGAGTWDVAMNVEAAAVEHELRRNVMPRFHAAFSLGTVLGAALGALASAAGVDVAWHLGLMAVVVGLAPAVAVRRFLPAGAHASGGGAASPTWRAWTEPRTLALGAMVLAMALTEGVANDWLAIALVDGYDVAPWVGAAGFATFVSAMTLGRMVGPVLLDAFGRVPVLAVCLVLAGSGVLLVVLGGALPVVALGIVLWGVGASLGFPVGMSAAADERAHAAARVSVVSTIGYVAFLAGPPLLGLVGDRIGVLRALLVVAALMVPTAFLLPTARPRGERGTARRTTDARTDSRD